MDGSATISAILKKTFIGKARDITDKSIFRHISLITFFAWVGLGSDPLSSSCYGPEEIMRNLAGHQYLSIFAAALTVITIFIISTSYRQIIRLFPHGGGGYIVASKLISPTVGMISGSALLIDYVLTITISISSGADAIFSFLPGAWHDMKLPFAFIILSILIVLNLRGVKESVKTLTPIFILFVLTHILLIGYSLLTHISETPAIIEKTAAETSRTVSELGIFGTLFIILKAYSMGAGTYTGIEAVSNGIPNLRDPKTVTAQKTMMLLSVSLAIAAFGLILSYYLFNLQPDNGKTLNAVLVQQVSGGWNPLLGKSFVFMTLISEAALLFVAAQTGFLDGPRVMANMAADHWIPKRFMHLSDRLVSRNGILIMGGAACLLLFISRGSVAWLVILYSINVFITFTLSQFGMVRHWIQARKSEKTWLRKMMVNGIGLIMTTFILITVIFMKFSEGGWLTLLITGLLAIITVLIKRHYNKTRKEVILLERVIKRVLPDIIKQMKKKIYSHTPMRRFKGNTNPPHTAVFLVNGYNGLGLYSFYRLIELFDSTYTNIAFMNIGIVDSQCFTDHNHYERLRETVVTDLQKYRYIAEQIGLRADCLYSLGTDVVEEIDNLIPTISAKYPGAVFFGGQFIFHGNPGFAKLLHNYTIFAIQRKLFRHGFTTIVLPISLDRSEIMSISANT